MDGNFKRVLKVNTSNKNYYLFYCIKIFNKLSKTKKKIQRSFRFSLSSGTINRKMAKKKRNKNRQNEFSTRYRVQS